MSNFDETVKYTRGRDDVTTVEGMLEQVNILLRKYQETVTKNG